MKSYRRAFAVILVTLLIAIVVSARNWWKKHRPDVVFSAIERKDMKTLRMFYPWPSKLHNSAGGTPLTDAVTRENSTATNYLLVIGSDPNEKDELGWSPLHRARGECLDLLLKAGAYVDPVAPHTGFTPLLMESATPRGYYSDVDSLLEAGANPNVVSPYYGLSPIMRACEGGNLENVKLLLKHGATIDGRDKKGKSALDYARESKYKPLIDFMENLQDARQR